MCEHIMFNQLSNRIKDQIIWKGL